MEKFSYMFSNSKVTDLNPLTNWNVSNGKNFSHLFYECKSLTNIDALDKLDMSNGNDFTDMFYKCYNITNKELLKKIEIKYKVEHKECPII